MINYQEKFDALLSQTLDKSTENQYLEEINSDPAIKAEFESYKDAYALANILERRSIKDKIQQISDNSETVMQKSTKWKKPLLLLLSFLGLITLLYLLNSKPKQVKPTQFAEEYFSPYPDKVTSMGENTLDMGAYNRKDYSAAINIFKANEGFESRFYQAICELALKDYVSAETTLSAIQQDVPNTYSKAFEWYLAMAKIGNNKVDEAIPFLENFANSQNSNYQKEAAKELLKSLR